MPVAIALTAAPILLSNAFQAFHGKRHGAALRRFWPFIAMMVVGVLIGAQLLTRADHDTIAVVVGTLLLLFVTVQFFEFRPNIPVAAERRMNPWIGLVSGLLGGVSSMFGPIAISYLVSLKLPKDEFNRQLSVLGLTEEQNGALLQLGEVRGDGGFDQIERILGGAPAQHAPLADLKGVFGLLDSMKVSEYCVFDPGVVRGLAYYTGTVFEAYSKGTLQRAMCGGGRYDNLLEEVGGPAMSGVGYGLGDVIVLDQLEEMDLLPESPPREGFFVINEGMEGIGEAMAIVSVVRLGLKQPCNYTYRRASLKKQMQEAAALNVRYVIVVADRLAVKDLETGEQRDLTVGKKLETQQQCEQFKLQLEKILAEWV